MDSSKFKQQPHFVLIPLMCPGHQIPMVDMARLLAEHQVLITIVATTRNALSFKSIIENDIKSGLSIRVLELRFLSSEVGLPDGCENIDSLPRDMESIKKFNTATKMLQQPIEEYVEKVTPNPNCIISDKYLPWTINISKKFNIPRIVFDGMSCFTKVCDHFIRISRIHETISRFESFIVPGLPDRIQLTKSQLPSEFNRSPVTPPGHIEQVIEAELASYGVVINTFEELESAYVQKLRKIRNKKVWFVGPVCLSNKDQSYKSQRGNTSSINENECLTWLDSWPQSSVIYVSFGTLNQISAQQLMQIGLGLLESNRPFIWVIKGKENVKIELKKMMNDENFEENNKGRGLLIWGWSPQVLILSHQSIGGFLTHCGWNSVLESVCAGVPMITWPVFTDQFYNEKIVVQILKIGESIGCQIDIKWGEENKCDLVVKKEQIKKIIDMVMDEGKEGQERRERVKKLAEIAKKSIGVGGSSYKNIELLISHIMQQS